MLRSAILVVLIGLVSAAACADVTWTTITGPVADSATWYNHVGTVRGLWK
jgi:hypothetical protein